MILNELISSFTKEQDESIKKAIIVRLNSIGINCNESNVIDHAKRIKQKTVQGTQDSSFYYYKESGEEVLLFRMLVENEIIIDGSNVKVITKIKYE